MQQMKIRFQKKNPPLELDRRGPKHEQVCLSGNVQNKEQSGYRADEPSTDMTSARPAKTQSRQKNIGQEKPDWRKPRRTEQGPQNREQSRCEEQALQGARTDGQKTAQRETNAGRDWKILQRGDRGKTG
jgi:hypothetical protein